MKDTNGRKLSPQEKARIDRENLAPHLKVIAEWCKANQMEMHFDANGEHYPSPPKKRR